mmetsp:Transcript_27199/g.83499  ORF Transcript_27199/g.83499 Transcript_27199/m.83499 type:complete len:395 (+) Transcript_27199:169-1353(+)
MVVVVVVVGSRLLARGSRGRRRCWLVVVVGAASEDGRQVGPHARALGRRRLFVDGGGSFLSRRGPRRQDGARSRRVLHARNVLQRRGVPFLARMLAAVEGLRREGGVLLALLLLAGDAGGDDVPLLAVPPLRRRRLFLLLRPGRRVVVRLLLLLRGLGLVLGQRVVAPVGDEVAEFALFFAAPGLDERPELGEGRGRGRRRRRLARPARRVPQRHRRVGDVRASPVVARGRGRARRGGGSAALGLFEAVAVLADDLDLDVVLVVIFPEVHGVDHGGDGAVGLAREELRHQREVVVQTFALRQRPRRLALQRPRVRRAPRRQPPAQRTAPLERRRLEGRLRKMLVFRHEAFELGPRLVVVVGAAFGDEDADGLVEVPGLDRAREGVADADDVHAF